MQGLDCRLRRPVLSRLNRGISQNRQVVMSDDDVSERDLFGSDDDDDDVPAPTPVVPAPTPSTWQLKKSTNLTPFQKQDLFTVLGNTNRDMTEGLLRSAVYGDGQLNPPRGEDQALAASCCRASGCCCRAAREDGGGAGAGDGGAAIGARRGGEQPGGADARGN